ncbi:hypothetical protein CLF_112701 [Clonorchis sinensis]|uniref:Uncharacterized protein n=1 Tax=Clonorchis sinensis TaxID=79923 RepID=G7YWU3_CLOSI|nr:hypothetical protein CLF_112701 [Clonorchis sinensis]
MTDVHGGASDRQSDDEHYVVECPQIGHLTSQHRSTDRALTASSFANLIRYVPEHLIDRPSGWKYKHAFHVPPTASKPVRLNLAMDDIVMIFMSGSLTTNGVNSNTQRSTWSKCPRMAFRLQKNCCNYHKLSGGWVIVHQGNAYGVCRTTIMAAANQVKSGL